MRTSPRSISRILLLAPILTLAGIARADQLIQFDNSSFVVAQRADGGISGYYVGHSDQPYMRKPDGIIEVCEFLFLGKKRQNGYEIKAWETSLIPAPESRIARGAIYIGYTDDPREWVFQFDEVPNGCRSKRDGDSFLWEHSNYFMDRNIPILYKEEQGVHVRATEKRSIIGIRVVRSDTASAFQVPAPNPGAKALFSVDLGGLVTAIRREKGFVLIEYIIPKTGRRLSGWIQERHLKDPFTKSN